MLHNLRFFSLQNAVYFIMLPFLGPVLVAFYLQDVLKFKCKIQAPKGYQLRHRVSPCASDKSDIIFTSCIEGHWNVTAPSQLQ